MKAAGQMAKGGSPYHKPTGYVAEPVESGEVLADWNITKRQSHEWQKLADIPDDAFDAALVDAEHPTTSGIIAAHAEPKPRQMDDRALWVWGRLQDFERMRVLDADPHELVGKMFEHMQETTKRLAPMVTEQIAS